MPIAKITGQGLAAISLSVALLWGCFIGERLVLGHAVTERAQLMRELHQLQRDHHAQPVSTPASTPAHQSRTPRIAVG